MMRPPTQSRFALPLAAAALGAIGLSPAFGQAPPTLPGLPPAGVAPRSAAKAVEPERELVGIRLGRQFLEVLRRFQAPNEVQTVALLNPSEQLPPLGGGGAMGGAMGGDSGMSMGAPGMGAMGGAMGAMGGAPSGAAGGPYGGAPGGAPGVGAFGGRPGGGGGAMLGGAPSGMLGLGSRGGGGGAMGSLGMGALDTGDSGSGGAPGAMGGMGEGAGMGAGTGTQLPEYSAATLWIYKRDDQQRGKNTVRLEFLINEDGKVAQISVAAPAGKTFPGVRTAQNISMGTSYRRVLEAYGYPERTRLLPGFRFMEAYFSKNHHAAFTFDMTKPSLPCVRITIALAD